MKTKQYKTKNQTNKTKQIRPYSHVRYLKHLQYYRITHPRSYDNDLFSLEKKFGPAIW